MVKPGKPRDPHQAYLQPPLAKRQSRMSMKQRKASTDSDRARLQRLNEYLERNFPDFFAEARFQVGNDDYFLYARFGQYLARTIEQNRASGAHQPRLHGAEPH